MKKCLDCSGNIINKNKDRCHICYHMHLNPTKKCLTCGLVMIKVGNKKLCGKCQEDFLRDLPALRSQKKKILLEMTSENLLNEINRVKTRKRSERYQEELSKIKENLPLFIDELTNFVRFSSFSNLTRFLKRNGILFYYQKKLYKYGYPSFRIAYLPEQKDRLLKKINEKYPKITKRTMRVFLRRG